MGGTLVDARADLYALGCIAYELLTGRPPFFGQTLAEIAGKHATVRPLAPSSLVAALPAEIDELCLRLLSKRPKDRVGHALDVARVLEKHGAGAGGPGPRPRAYLYRPELAGRSDVVAKIRSRLRELKNGGGLVLLRGESGVGKTRVLMAAIEEARRHRVACIAGRSEPGIPQPLRSLRALLEHVAGLCQERGHDATERILGGRARTLAPFEPALARVPGFDELPPLESCSPDEARERLLSAIALVLGALSEGQPHLLVLDDLQWADELTVAALSFLARSGTLAEIPVLVVATHRAEEETAALRELATLPGCDRHDLPRLDRASVASIVSDMLADREAPEAIVDVLARQSEGNPFFLAEYLRAAVLEGLLVRDLSGRWHAGAPIAFDVLPAALHGIVSARIAALDGDARALLEAAAVLGRDVEVSVLQEVLGWPTEALVAPLWDLARRHLVAEIAPDLLRFDHDKIREVALAGIEPSGRRRLHARAAAVLSTLRGEDPDAQAQIGLHYRDAGDRQRARPCFLAAARRAESSSALTDAEQLYRDYLDLVDAPDVESVRVGNELGSRVLAFVGKMAEAHEVHLRTLDQARVLCDPASLSLSLRSVAYSLLETGHPDEAVPRLEESLAINREVGDLRNEGLTLRLLGLVKEQLGELAAAELLFRRAVAILEDIGSPHEKFISVMALCQLLIVRSESEESYALAQRLVALARAAGEARDVPTALSVLGLAQHVRRDTAGARASWEEALPLFRAAKNLRGELCVLVNHAAVLIEEQRLDEALLLYERSRHLAVETGDGHVESSASRSMADVHLRMGHPARAREEVDRALGVARAIRYRLDEALALGTLAEIERLTGDLHAADRALEEGAAILRSCGETIGELGFFIASGHHRLARGESAAAILDEARDRAAAANDPGTIEALRKLEAAIEASRGGRSLVGGELPDALPAGLRRHLAGGSASR
ncbi:MAG: AAA family ATPase [Acidobacteriota bacterium]